jgi:hypothetical protein
MTQWQAEFRTPKKYKPRGEAPDPRLSMRGELRRAIVWRSRPGFWRRNARQRSFWRGWWCRRRGWNEAFFVLLLGLTMRVVGPLPLLMDALGIWRDRRSLGLDDLGWLGRRRFDSR